MPRYCIAVMSDIHGNLPALNAVLADVDTVRPDKVFCLGDLVDFAPWPNEVIDAIALRHIPTVMGNHDERHAFGIDAKALAKHSPEEQAARARAIEITRLSLTTKSQQYLALLPTQIRLPYRGPNGTGEILLVHASPRSIDEYIYEDHPEDDLNLLFEQSDADILIMGHTHRPYIRSVMNGRKLALNAGSVGRSKETASVATYLLLTITESLIETEIRRIRYDVDETIKKIHESEIPNFYADFLLAGKNA